MVIGTRPEAIKMAPVAIAFRESGEPVRVTTILTAQHREMSDEVLRLFRIEPDHDLDVMKPGQSLFETTARLLPGLERVYNEEKPDLVLVQGDTTTTFVGGLAAYYLRIPVGHVEAGLRTRDKHNPFPEEINRRLTSAVADLHFAPTETARRALLAEGVPDETIHVTGNTVIDALLWMTGQVKDAPCPLEQFAPVLERYKRMILITGHRRENFGEPFHRICEALKQLSTDNPRDCFVYPVHLNPNVQASVRKYLEGLENFFLLPPLPYPAFVWFMNRSYMIVTDSGGIQEEAPALGKPLLVTRRVTERPEALEAGVLKLVGDRTDELIQSAQRLLDDPEFYLSMARGVSPYGDGKASGRILDFLADADLS